MTGHDITSGYAVGILNSTLRAIIEATIDYMGHPSKHVFAILNNIIHDNLPVDASIAFTYMELVDDGTMTGILAGNPFPFVYSIEKKELMYLNKNNIVAPNLNLGFMPTIEVGSRRRKSKLGMFTGKHDVAELKYLGPDIFVFCTDGLTDVFNSKDESYTRHPDGLKAALDKTHSDGAKDIYSQIIKGVSCFGKITDDIAVAVIKRTY